MFRIVPSACLSTCLHIVCLPTCCLLFLTPLYHMITVKSVNVMLVAKSRYSLTSSSHYCENRHGCLSTEVHYRIPVRVVNVMLTENSCISLPRYRINARNVMVVYRQCENRHDCLSTKLHYRIEMCILNVVIVETSHTSLVIRYFREASHLSPTALHHRISALFVKED